MFFIPELFKTMIAFRQDTFSTMAVDKDICEASLQNQENAKQDLELAESHQQRMKEAIQNISKVYHPVDLEIGLT